MLPSGMQPLPYSNGTTLPQWVTTPVPYKEPSILKYVPKEPNSSLGDPRRQLFCEIESRRWDLWIENLDRRKHYDGTRPLPNGQSVYDILDTTLRVSYRTIFLTLYSYNNCTYKVRITMLRNSSHYIEFEACEILEVL